MSHIYRYVLCLLLFAAGVTSVKAQQYPVTASTQIIPPYSVYLPDYAVAGSDKLRVILVQNDLTLPSYNVRLRMTVEQNGTVIMRTATAFNPRPLSLSPGIPTIIGGIDLADYLNPANIEYSGGFSRTEYEKTRSLPEGAYRISFTAYDYARPQVQVSNMGSNVFFFRKSDPPLLNLPICNSRVEKLDPQFLTFNWSSRNSPNPVPGSGTEYVFSLYEIRPAGSNPDYIVRSAKPIYTLVTETNTIVYGPGEPQLRDSMQYVWTVQARDKSGRDMFSNQGLSQSCTFTYLGKNPFTQNNVPKPVLKGRATGERSVRFGWPLAAANYQVEAYRLQYRATKVGDTEFDWQTEEKQSDTAFTASSLEPNRAYEGRLQWKIAGVYGPFSDLVTIKTDSAKTFVCGDAGLLAALDNQTPQPALSAGKIIRVGNFDIILTEVSGGNGKFTGKGRVITLGFGIGLQMEFKDITVNTDLKVIAGQVTAVTEGIDKFVSDKLDEQHGGNDVGGVVNGDLVPDITTKLKIFSPANIKVNTDAGTITLTDSNTGQEEVINYKDKGKTLPLVLEDADGNLYNIDKGGKVTSIGKRDNAITSAVLESLKTLQLDKGTVTFTAGTSNVYAFDAWKSSYSGKTNVEKEYESLASGKYHVSSKAIVPGEQEQVTATLTNAASGISASKLKFITGKGIVLTAKDNGDNSFTISLTGGPGGDAQEIYAAHPDGNGGYISLGKLLVPSYKPLQKTLVLVPIGAQTPVATEQIKTALQKTYGKLGITYTVKVDESFRYNKTWDSNGDSVLQDKGSAFLSNNFTGEEKALKKAYKKATNIDDNSVYLFLVNEAALSDGDLTGKMPRGSQFGFVFTKQASEAAVVRTVVHEIGHGDYTLEHTFSTNVGLDKSSTDNLMDYGSGYGLIKYQWDVLHDPGSVWGVFEDDNAGDNYTAMSIARYFLNADSTTVSFLTPAGTILVVPFKDLGSVEFQYGAIKIKDKQDHFDPEITVGAVRSFKLANSQRLLRRYEYVVADGTYKDPEGNVYQQNVPDPAKVEGFVYPVSCSDKYKLMKFSRRTLPFYKGGEPKLTFTQMTDLFTPFRDQEQMPMRSINPITHASEEIEQEIVAGTTLGCLYCVSNATLSMTEKHCRQDEYIWIDKLAQMRNVYPEYFDRFTQTNIVKTTGGATTWEKDGNWEAPETITGYSASGTPGAAGPTGTSRIVHDYDYPWGQYLVDHPDIKAAYGKDDILFFKTFYTQFIEYVNTVIVDDEEFWEKFSSNTPVKDVFEQLRKDPIFHLQSISVEKRGLALKMMTDGYNNQDIILLGGKDLSYIRLLSSFIGDKQAAAMLQYIEDNIKVRKIYDLYVTDGKPEASQVGVLMALSNMITTSGHYNYNQEGMGDLLLAPGLVAEIEADLFQFSNAQITFAADNKLFINTKLYNYNDYIAVRVAGSFEMDGKTIPKGQLLTMPAVQVALMATIADMRKTEKQISLAVDVGMMCIGIGDLKIFLNAGQYIAKAIVVADVVGSAGDLTLQMINADAISPEWRTSLQIATMALSLPSMIKAAPKVEKYVEDLDLLLDARRAHNATMRELMELERIGSGLSESAGVMDIISDGKQIEKRAVSMDRPADIELVKKRLDRGKIDNNIYLVVHGDGSKFRIIHQGQEIEMDHRSLARWIKKQGFPADKQLVLLSCGNIETAQDVARKAKVSIVANDGVVKVYDNGVIEAENGFKYIDKNGNIDESRKVLIGEQKPAGKRPIRLGPARPRTGSVDEIVGNFGVTAEIAEKLAANDKFVEAYKAVVGGVKRQKAGGNFMLALESTADEAADWADSKKKLLALFANTPETFDKVYENMVRAEELAESAGKMMASGLSASNEAQAMAAIRTGLTDMFKDMNIDIEESFFLNGIFNGGVTDHIPFGDHEWAIIDAARDISKIAGNRNILVVHIYVKGELIPIALIAGSGNSAVQIKKGLKIDEVIEDVPDGVRNFEQFTINNDRVQDSESKFVEWFRKQTDIDISKIERIEFFSERPVCPSCTNVLGIFSRDSKIPEIKIYEGRYRRK
ncbi:hypothetical protein [Chitinophaga filiformis]|uniref:Fibronectin type-III domain-containing protein n=1 Tax=Chitinophaga filiformis TaxID=104663 RepID=A0A1G8AIT9_CHIFI|nr:hypothetical protein [Chitinophaga filiformis]SDH20922.1 hypothetical protein SAMN04488121_109278 [Chitinophaga filiformis]